MRKLLGGFMALVLALQLGVTSVGALPKTSPYRALLPSFDGSWYTREAPTVLRSKYDFFLLGSENSGLLVNYWTRRETLYYGWDGVLYPIMEGVRDICGAWGSHIYLAVYDSGSEQTNLLRYNPVTGSSETVVENAVRGYISPETGGNLFYTTTTPFDVSQMEWEPWWNPDFRYELRKRNLYTGEDIWVWADEEQVDPQYGTEGPSIGMDYRLRLGRLSADIYYPIGSEIPHTRYLVLDTLAGDVLEDSHAQPVQIDERYIVHGHSWDLAEDADRDNLVREYPYTYTYAGMQYILSCEGTSWGENTLALTTTGGTSLLTIQAKEGGELHVIGPMGESAPQYGPFVFIETHDAYLFVVDLNLRQLYVRNGDDSLVITAAQGWDAA